MLAVPQHVAAELLFPVRDVALGHRRSLAAPVSMPEASMYEHDAAMSRQDDIRVAGQVLAMQSEAISHPMNHRADHALRGRVLASDAAHNPASFLDGERIRHVDEYRQSALRSQRTIPARPRTARLPGKARASKAGTALAHHPPPALRSERRRSRRSLLRAYSGPRAIALGPSSGVPPQSAMCHCPSQASGNGTSPWCSGTSLTIPRAAGVCAQAAVPPAPCRAPRFALVPGCAQPRAAGGAPHRLDSFRHRIS